MLAWESAYNQRDTLALIKPYVDDAENLQGTSGDESLLGKEVLLKSFEIFSRAFPDTYTNIENLLVDSEWAIVEWRGGGISNVDAIAGGETEVYDICKPNLRRIIGERPI